MNDEPIPLDHVKELIQRHIDCRRYFKRARTDGCICPNCGSGAGQHGTGGVHIYETNTWHCFNCGTGRDVIDAHRLVHGGTFRAAVEELAREIGVSRILWPDGHISNLYPTSRPAAVPQTIAPPPKPQPERPPADFTRYFARCAARMGSFEEPEPIYYLHSRQISCETAQRYGLGYDPTADPAAAPGSLDDRDPRKRHPRPCIILPFDTSYTARRIDGRPDHKKMNPPRDIAGPQGVFNATALYDETQEGKAEFICEGAFSALSIAEAKTYGRSGAEAIAINGKGNARRLIDRFTARRPTPGIFVLALDNDAAGREGTQVLAEGLTALHIPCITAPEICGAYNDPNDHLTADKDGFFAAVQTAEVRAMAHLAQLRQEEETHQ